MLLRRRFAVVYNARAGIALPRRLDGVLARLRARGAEVVQLPARSAAEASERVAEAARTNACDAVIAAGGDGTFRAVASGAAGTPLPVGLVPLGTGNVLARELRLPRRASALAAVLADGRAIAAHGGLVNGAPFFLMAGAGFDGRIIAGIDYATKRMIGRGAFVAPVLRAISEGPQFFDVSVDGAPMRASWAIVARSSRYGGFVLTQDTGLGSPAMVAVVIEAETRMQLIGVSLALALGRLADPKTRPAFVRVLRADVVEMGRRAAAPVEIDGDEAGFTPVSISSAGPVVRVIAPPGYAPPLPPTHVADVTDRKTNHVR